MTLPDLFVTFLFAFFVIEITIWRVICDSRKILMHHAEHLNRQQQQLIAHDRELRRQEALIEQQTAYLLELQESLVSCQRTPFVLDSMDDLEPTRFAALVAARRAEHEMN